MNISGLIAAILCAGLVLASCGQRVSEPPIVASSTAVLSEAGSSSTASSEPQLDVKWDTVEPTVELLQKYDDILSPFPYQKSGEQMTDDEIVVGFTALYQSGHTVYYWYRSPEDLHQEVDTSALKIVDSQETEWCPAKRMQTLGEATALVESIFTQRYRMNALDGCIDRFRSYDGRLYINCTSGGLGDPYEPRFDTVKVLAKTPDAILVEMGIGFSNVPTANSDSIVFTLLHQGEFWVLDNWL